VPTFKPESVLPTRWGTFLLPIPSIQWFADSVLQALAEMTIRENWYSDSESQASLGVAYASEMLARYKLVGFNPFPEGMIMPFGGTVAPDGFLICDGSSYLATDYPELFAQIGYYFGGSGANFNVPSLINRVPVGSGGDFAIGESGGESSVTLTTTNMPSHSHSDIGHAHSIPLNASFITQEGVGVGRLLNIPLLTDSTGIGFANIQNTGGDGAHNNMQPFQAMLYIIYAGR